MIIATLILAGTLRPAHDMVHLLYLGPDVDASSQSGDPGFCPPRGARRLASERVLKPRRLTWPSCWLGDRMGDFLGRREQPQELFGLSATVPRCSGANSSLRRNRKPPLASQSGGPDRPPRAARGVPDHHPAIEAATLGSARVSARSSRWAVRRRSVKLITCWSSMIGSGQVRLPRYPRTS
jgi:hypothetical protein